MNIFDACKWGDLNRVKELLLQSVDWVIIAASAFGHVDIVKVLLEAA
jgi:hypothetical protein